jgi:hypothetical protein
MSSEWLAWSPEWVLALVAAVFSGGVLVGARLATRWTLHPSVRRERDGRGGE